jgi:hypothetical protein
MYQEEAERRFKETDATRRAAEEEARRIVELNRAEQEEMRKSQALTIMHNIIERLNQNSVSELRGSPDIHLDTVSMKILCEALITNISCKSINFSRRGLTDSDIAPLCELLETSSTIRRVIVDENRLGPISLKRFGEILARNSSLRLLSLRMNDLTNEGKEVFPSLLFAQNVSRNSGLKSLDVSFCNLEPESVSELCKAIQKNSRIMSIDITGNRYNDDAWDSIRKVCHANRQRLLVDRPRGKTENDHLSEEDDRSRKYVLYKQKGAQLKSELETLRYELNRKNLESAQENFESRKSERETVGLSLLEASRLRIENITLANKTKNLTSNRTKKAT